MVFSLTWLPDVLDRAGLKYAEVPGWRTRGRREMAAVRGVIVHHTAGSPNGNMPSLDLLVKGRPDLSGPLAQLGLGRDGTFYVIAAGVANHAGEGKWRGVTPGNPCFIGIEAENTGRRDDPWPEVQMDALRRGVAAILAHIGTDANMVCGHKEFALPPGRKPDPLWDMAPFRESVVQIMADGVPKAPAIPARDALSRPTLRRGAKGDVVAALQAKLGVESIGLFGPKTEAAVRALQRQHNLVPDGIVGPKTWALVDMIGATPPSPALQPPSGNAAIGGATLPGESASAASADVSDALPPADDEQHPVGFDGSHALTPAGVRFARKQDDGFMVSGKITVRAALAADPAIATGIPPGRVAVIAAVSGNEGKLEAVNSYDRAFMSFGIMQWTAGAASKEGELASLLALMKHQDPPAFAECFGRFGLDIAITPGGTTGFLTIEGRRLDDPAAKAVLRLPVWAYRFWRAGHHPAVQRAEIVHALSRFDKFVDLELSGHPLRAWVNSQLGMAHLLDQHVNRPSELHPTIRTALAEILASGSVPADPARWSESDEKRLIEGYLKIRAGTAMTDSKGRAERLAQAAARHELRTERGSFV